MHRSCLKNSTRCNEECKWSWCSCSLLKGCSAQVFGWVACFSSPVKLLRKSDAAGAVHAWRAAAPTRNQTTQIKQKMLFGLFKEPRGAVHVRKPDPVWKVGDVRPHFFLFPSINACVRRHWCGDIKGHPWLRLQPFRWAHECSSRGLNKLHLLVRATANACDL